MSISSFSLWTRMYFMGLNVIFPGHFTTGVIFFKIVYIVSIFPIVSKCLFIIISSNVCRSWLCCELRLTSRYLKATDRHTS